MGSSVKKKKDKKKDFQVCVPLQYGILNSLLISVQKPKLKVGKARPKGTNFTDTSFKSKCMFQLNFHEAFFYLTFSQL